MRIFLSTLLLASTIVSQAYAGAWTQAEGSTKTITTASFYSSNSRYGANGNVLKQGKYAKHSLNPYVEYGLWDGTTIGANLFVERVKSAGQNNTGIGDSEWFVRQRVWEGKGAVLSLQPMLKLPSPTGGDDLPEFGSDNPDAGLSVLGGYGFELFGQQHYIDGELGYRYRFGDPKDQIIANFAAGVRLHQDVMILSQTFGTFNTSTMNNPSFTQSASDDFDLIKQQVSAVYQFAPGTHLQAGLFTDITGRNVGRGNGGLMAVWLEF